MIDVSLGATIHLLAQLDVSDFTTRQTVYLPPSRDGRGRLNI